MNDAATTVSKPLFTISQMATQHHMTLRALRFYEEKGLIAPMRIGKSRLYDAGDVVKIKLIQAGKRLGFSLLEIDRLIRDYKALHQTPPTDLCDLLDKRSVGDQLTRLTQQRNTVDEAIAELKASLGNDDDTVV